MIFSQTVTDNQSLRVPLIKTYGEMMSDITNNSPRIENNYLELKAVSIVFRVSGLCINFMLGKK